MIRTSYTSFLLLLTGLLLLLTGTATAQNQKVRITPSSTIPMDTNSPRSRTTFRTTGDTKRGDNPFQQTDFTNQTKQATGHTPNGRVPSLGSPRGDNDIPQRELP